MPKYLDKDGLEEFFDDIKDLVHGPSYLQVSSWMDAHPDVLSSVIATDVADATDNWIDEHPEVTSLVQDGSISFNKLADTARKGYVRSFETVADMQAATDLKADMTCHTNGFHTSGDGGAAYYTISASGTANDMDILALQGGLLATLMITEPYVAPEQFGAWGDGTNDDTTAVQRSIDFATGQSISVEFNVGKTYSVSTGITIGRVDVSMNSPIRYTGNGAAITIGSSSSSVARHSYKIWVTSSKVEYTNGSIGLQVYNATNCDFDIHVISGFEYGAIFSGYNAGFGYNHISTNLVLNCMYSITLRSDGTNGWCNENYFYNGRLGVESNASYKSSFVGITIDSDHAYMANANTFSNMSIEAAAICIHIVYGAFNSFNHIRSEAAALVFKDENSSNWNYVNVSYGTTGAETVGPMDVVEGYLRNYQAFSMPVFDSGFLPSKSFSNDSYLWLGKDICFMDTNGVLRQVYKGVKYNDHLHITSRNMGVMVDTTNAKKFNVTAMPYNDLGWRVFVVCYDANGNYIDTGVKSNSNRVFSLSNGATISGVTCWVTGNTATGASFFEVPDSCVRAFIGIIAATDICGFKILSNVPTNAIIGNQVANGLASIPTCEGKVGDFCPSSAADSVLGWLYNGTSWVAIS